MTRLASLDRSASVAFVPRMRGATLACLASMAALTSASPALADSAGGDLPSADAAAVDHEPPTCGGKEATMYLGFPANIVHGTSGDDVIIVSALDVTIYAGAGNDTICAVGGTGDVIYGGPGNDEIYGGSGVDDLLGEDGNDTIRGKGADDYIDGGSGRDDMFGGDGHDRIYGRAGDDDLDGNAGGDFVYGGPDRDHCVNYLHKDSCRPVFRG